MNRSWPPEGSARGRPAEPPYKSRTKRPVEQLVGEFKALRLGYLEELADLHETYTTTVSTLGMAISLEAVATLCAICHAPQVKKVADLGSGFTSAAFRNLVAQGVVEEVQTFDDDSEWLERSKEFCLSNDLSGEGFSLWSDDIEGEYDFVVYDLGRMSTRAACVKEPARICVPGGLVFYDDAHKADYGPVLSAETARRTLYDVTSSTLDGFKRYGLLAMV